MASISQDDAGNVRIQFVAVDRKRKAVRLGKVSRKLTESIQSKVETLNAIAIAMMPIDSETARWVAGIGDELAARLAAAKPPNTTEWIAPNRAQARMANTASGMLGM